MRKVARNAMCMRKGWSTSAGAQAPDRAMCMREGWSVRAERTFFFSCMGGCSCAPFFSRRRPREITGGTTRKGDLARLHSASGLHGTNALAAARSSATSREHVTIRTIRPFFLGVAV